MQKRILDPHDLSCCSSFPFFDNVTERFSVTSTEFTLVPLFNLRTVAVGTGDASQRTYFARNVARCGAESGQVGLFTQAHPL